MAETLFYKRFVHTCYTYNNDGCILFQTHKLCKNFECRNTKPVEKEKMLEKEQTNETNNTNIGGDGPSIPILETVDT